MEGVGREEGAGEQSYQFVAFSKKFFSESHHPCCFYCKA